MDFILSLLDADQRALHERAEELGRTVLSAMDRAANESAVVNRPIAQRLADEGLLDFAVPGAYGTRRGPLPAPATMSLTAFCLVRQALARHSPTAELIFTMQGLGAGPISFSGTEEQRRRFLPRIASGSLIAAFALTEPDAGSDVAAIETSARRDGSCYVLDGRKTFISMAPDADLYTVFAKTDPSAGNKGISAFIVEKGMPGFNAGERMALLSPHPIGAPVFDACRVPVENRIGDENAGFKVAMTTLDFFRTTVAACAVGFAQRALDEAVTYARKRRMFGRPIAEYQATQLKLAAMATELAAARLLTFRAALMRDRGVKARLTLESSQAKLYATEAAQRIIDQALQIHGGIGLLKGVEVERLYREIRALRIYEGTSEIQHLIIAGQLLRDQA
jgi:acyl-CoA dehydrogenase